MRMVDVVEENPRVICVGGAGTGKTFLAERLAQRWAEAGMQVVLVCRSPWLKHFLASRLSMPGITVALMEGVLLDCRRAGLTRFDAAIVDEGQDLLDVDSVQTLDRVLDGGLHAGRWSWFQDLNQSLFPACDTQAKNFLFASDPVRVPLRTNCRNTRIILEWIQEALDADVGVKGAGAGPEVRLRTAPDGRESAALIALEIVELVDQGHLAPGFAKIDEFKGLENDAIIVADLPDPILTGDKSVAHYVAMSRARSVLSLIHLMPA